MKYFEKLCKSIGKIQGIGKKTSLKIAYYLCYENKNLLEELQHDLQNAAAFIQTCKNCGNLAENELCDFCTDTQKSAIVCLIEHPKDLFFIEEARAFDGRYFVFERANEFYLKRLEKFVNLYEIKEIIIAFSPNISTDSLCFYIEEYFKNYDIKVSKIAQGVPNGIKIQDIDAGSLASALINRINFKED